MSKPRRRLEVLGLAPPGFCCGLCGQGGTLLQIAMPHSRIGLFHRDCAEELFCVPVREPPPPKVASRLGLDERK